MTTAMPAKTATGKLSLKLRYFVYFAMILSCTHGTALADLKRAKIGLGQNTEKVEAESD